jgi:hypothetical protein
MEARFLWVCRLPALFKISWGQAFADASIISDSIPHLLNLIAEKNLVVKVA